MSKENNELHDYESNMLNFLLTGQGQLPEEVMSAEAAGWALVMMRKDGILGQYYSGIQKLMRSGVECFAAIKMTAIMQKTLLPTDIDMYVDKIFQPINAAQNNASV